MMKRHASGYDGGYVTSISVATGFIMLSCQQMVIANFLSLTAIF